MRGLLLLLCAASVPLAAATPPPPLRELAAARGLQIGTAVKPGPLADDERYREVLLRHFSVITPENEMKMKRVAPAPGTWKFAEADAIVGFARQHRLTVRGHTLVWNADQHTPDWLQQQPADRTHAGRLMREHIFTVMHRYRGSVRDWDVVNEAVSNDNRPGASAYVDGYWLRAMGPDYIATAFRLAREADPDARLFYNDYDHGQALGPKSDRIYELLLRLKAEGVPVDGVGLQLHCNLEKPPVKAHLVRNFRRLGALGLRVQVTELDVEIMTASGSLEERLARQAAVYRDVVAAALESGCVEAVVMWGFSDKFRQTGLLRRKNLPDQETPMWIFDGQYQPKPAFWAIVDTLSASSEP
jgi:endo-1,4-beta-xylanase